MPAPATLHVKPEKRYAPSAHTAQNQSPGGTMANMQARQVSSSATLHMNPEKRTLDTVSAHCAVPVAWRHRGHAQAGPLLQPCM